MTNKLQQYFPMLCTREEILHEIEHQQNLRRTFYSWSEKAQNEFLDFTTGAKGVKMMYDFASKELLNPEIQKNGYDFPGQRSACYSADLLLRQYKRVQQKNRPKDPHAKIHYKDIKNISLFLLTFSRKLSTMKVYQ